jgi:pyruvate, water dikinase
MIELIPLRDARSSTEVGGKAAALGDLIRAEFTVPDGFVVATDASELNRLTTAILDAFESLESPFVAVRSSATQEDSLTAAWAGQLDTFLNVSRETLMESILSCMASVESARARAYATEKGLAAGRVAVIVQSMVPSDVSGVCFSVHPVTKNTNDMVIEAAYGLGEAVVSGEVTPDNYVVDRAARRVAIRSISTQSRSLRFSPKEHKTIWENVDEPSVQKLSDTQILELADTVERLESHVGYPVDVEWTFYDDRLYILQSRPITTLA